MCSCNSVIESNLFISPGTESSTKEQYQHEKKSSSSTMHVNGHSTHGARQEMGKLLFKKKRKQLSIDTERLKFTLLGVKIKLHEFLLLLSSFAKCSCPLRKEHNVNRGEPESAMTQWSPF